MRVIQINNWTIIAHKFLENRIWYNPLKYLSNETNSPAADVKFAHKMFAFKQLKLDINLCIFKIVFILHLFLVLHIRFVSQQNVRLHEFGISHKLLVKNMHIFTYLFKFQKY